MRLFIILVLALHMAPGVRSGNKASEVIMADYPNSIDDEFVGCKEEMYNQVQGDLHVNNDIGPTNEGHRGQAYKVALEGLCTSIEDHYPATHDPRRVAECKQKLDDGGTKEEWSSKSP
ncbi:hypothetical protein AOLI_G00242610 [Acnodon oligacanthus]